MAATRNTKNKQPVKADSPFRILIKIAANIPDQADSRLALKQIDLIHRHLIASGLLIKG